MTGARTRGHYENKKWEGYLSEICESTGEFSTPIFLEDSDRVDTYCDLARITRHPIDCRHFRSQQFPLSGGQMLYKCMRKRSFANGIEPVAPRSLEDLAEEERVKRRGLVEVAD